MTTPGADWLLAAGWRLLGVAAGVAAAATGLLGGLGYLWRPEIAGAVLAGGGVTLVFFALGQLLQLACARLDARYLLVVALVAYSLQVVTATILIQALTALGLNGRGLTAGLVAAVLGWLAGLIGCFRKLRIPVYDPLPEGENHPLDEIPHPLPETPPQND